MIKLLSVILLVSLGLMPRPSLSRPTIQGYEAYYPGKPQPALCEASYSYSLYDAQFYCHFSARPSIWVNGSSGVITSTQFFFEDIRLGDVLDALGMPESVQRDAHSWRLQWAHAYLYTHSLSPEQPVGWLLLMS